MKGISVKLAERGSVFGVKVDSAFLAFPTHPQRFKVNLVPVDHQVLPVKSAPSHRLTVSLRKTFWQNPSR
jgi:hypothetical protein